MLRENFHRNAFAIRFKPLKGNKFDKASFHALMKEVSGDFPRMEIEGITAKRRGECDYSPIFEVGHIMLAKLNKEKRNLIAIGVNEDFDVSFEREKDIRIGGFWNRVPILDISNDKEEILERLEEYLRIEYPVSYAANTLEKEEEQVIQFKVVKAKEPVITYYSTFVQVDNAVFSWTEWNRIKHDYGVRTKPRAKKVRFVGREKKTAVRSVISILRGQY